MARLAKPSSKTVSIGAYRDRRAHRLDLGRRQRKVVSRQQLAEFNPHKRHFDPVEVLLNDTEGRLSKLLPIKYGRMAQSPFAFFRGSVSIMAEDLAREPHTGLFVQLCGDAHLQNLGCFAGPDGRLIFDINDFDQTIAGPWEWDVKRMAASIILAGAESNHGKTTSSKAAMAFVSSYCNRLSCLADEAVLTTARYQIHQMANAEAVNSAIEQARRATPQESLEKYTDLVKGKRQLKPSKNNLWRVVGKERSDVLESLKIYRESLAPDRLHLFEFFHVMDIGFKVVGTGSVGLRNYVVLMEGNGEEDPLFLQLKQEVSSCYAHHLNSRPFAHQGARVVQGQRKMQALSDLLLGWTRIGEHDYLVRQLNDHKGSVDFSQLKGEGLSHLASVAGELLARGHARSGDALQIKGYIGNGEKIQKSIVDYALAYAETANADFELFQKAIRSGRIQIEV